MSRRAQAEQSDDRLRIGFVGTLAWHKGAHVLVDAVRTLPASSYELRIFGDPAVAAGYAADLRRRADGLPVRFMGPFDRAGTAAVYGEVDVLVVPSLWPENSPLVIREAFMAGVPVVAARIGGISELVTDGVNGLLFNPRRTEELSSALRTLVVDRSRLEAFARAIPAVKSMKEHAAEWEGIYAEVLSARADGPAEAGRHAGPVRLSRTRRTETNRGRRREPSHARRHVAGGAIAAARRDGRSTRSSWWTTMGRTGGMGTLGASTVTHTLTRTGQQSGSLAASMSVFARRWNTARTPCCS